MSTKSSRTARRPVVDMEAGEALVWRGFRPLQEDGHVYEGPRHLAAGGRSGRPSRQGPTLRDKLRGYGWKRMSWRMKLVVVFAVLWALGTINERLDQDRTFQPVQPPRQQSRECTKDEYLDVRSMTCIHIDNLENDSLDEIERDLS